MRARVPWMTRVEDKDAERNSSINVGESFWSAMFSQRPSPRLLRLHLLDTFRQRQRRNHSTSHIPPLSVPPEGWTSVFQQRDTSKRITVRDVKAANRIAKAFLDTLHDPDDPPVVIEAFPGIDDLDCLCKYSLYTFNRARCIVASSVVSSSVKIEEIDHTGRGVWFFGTFKGSNTWLDSRLTI